MENLIIYGVGMGLNAVNYVDYWQYIEERYRIRAIVDGNSSLEGKEIDIRGRKYKVITNNQSFWLENLNCYVYITANKFYSEIKKDLLGKGVMEKHILKKNFLEDEYLSLKFSDEYIYGKGIEIGGPSSIFKSIYQSCISCDDVDFAIETIWNKNKLTDTFVLEDGTVLGKRFIADATDLHLIGTEIYDFVLSSNNIEHMANPLKAILEFIRILKNGGSLIVVVPNKVYNFDHNREDTLFSHIKEDFNNNMLEDDLKHLDEILEKHDLGMDMEMTFDEFKSRSLNNYCNRCLHHHVFSLKLLKDIAQYFELDIKELGEVFGDFYMVAVK